jgi:GAF domain-containing protein
MHSPDADERRRVSRLTALQALNRAHPIDFADVIALGKVALRMPIVAVSLLDSDYLHVIAVEGADLTCVPREQTFCTYAIRSDAVMVVNDTHLDERFVAHPYVVEAPHLRFYAGAPIIYEAGIRLGTVCVADARPRQVSPGGLLILEHLAALAVERFRGLAGDSAQEFANISTQALNRSALNPDTAPRVVRWG